MNGNEQQSDSGFRSEQRLYFFTPYSLHGRLGKAYNEYMELVPHEDAWVCFLDRDVMFLTPDYGHQMSEIIAQNPHTGLFTCLTNRIGCQSQLYRGVMSDDRDILNHRKIAVLLQTEHRHEVEQIRSPVSGFLMVLQKKIWRNIRFDEKKSLLHVDWDFTTRVMENGFPILLMRGLYVFHYYRFNGDRSDFIHLR